MSRLLDLGKLESERPTHVLTPREGLSEFSGCQAALSKNCVRLLAVDGSHS